MSILQFLEGNFYLGFRQRVTRLLNIHYLVLPSLNKQISTFILKKIEKQKYLNTDLKVTLNNCVILIFISDAQFYQDFFI